MHSSISFLTVPLVLLALLPALSVSAEPAGCHAAARTWISELKNRHKIDLLQRYTAADCDYSAQWMEKYRDVSDPDARNQMCTDLVLLWTRKDCLYFRDVHNTEAYEPCTAWSRQMYRHCMENDEPWFSTQKEGAGQ